MKSKLIGELRECKPGAQVTLSLSLQPGTESPADVIRKLMAKGGGSVNIVDVRPIARVVSVRGKPRALVPLIESAEIQDALYSNEPDVFPKPVRQRPVDINNGEGFHSISAPKNAKRSGQVVRGRTKVKK